MSKGINFRFDAPAGEILCSWWRALDNDRGGRADLRRCSRPIEASFNSSHHKLSNELNRKFPQEKGLDNRILCVSPLRANVKYSGGEDFGKGKMLAKQMAEPKSSGGESVLSELRFMRFLECESRDDLFPQLRRIINLLDNKVDIYDLADMVYFWGDRKKRDLARQYYSTNN